MAKKSTPDLWVISKCSPQWCPTKDCHELENWFDKNKRKSEQNNKIQM